MTPLKVCFTGLEFDPANALQDRVQGGIMPEQWYRYRFTTVATQYQINRWLETHIEGRWAILRNRDKVTIAFELPSDGSLFVLSDGGQQCVPLP